jgi:hypothetical protein
VHASPNRLTAYPPTLREAPVADPAVPRMELAEWAERYGLVAGITTRHHGFSLGLWSAENVGQVMTRWRAFRAACGRAFPVSVVSHQIHGSAVQWHDRAPRRLAWRVEWHPGARRGAPEGAGSWAGEGHHNALRRWHLWPVL